MERTIGSFELLHIVNLIPRAPYGEWTRKIGPQDRDEAAPDAELAEYQPLFDNAE